MWFIPANICLHAIAADECSPILVLHKSHKACSHWHVVHGAPKIEENRKPAKLSIKLWQESGGKHGPTEDTPVTYRGLGIILVKTHPAKYIITNKHRPIYRYGVAAWRLSATLGALFLLYFNCSYWFICCVRGANIYTSVRLFLSTLNKEFNLNSQNFPTFPSFSQANRLSLKIQRR